MTKQEYNDIQRRMDMLLQAGFRCEDLLNALGCDHCHEDDACDTCKHKKLCDAGTAAANKRTAMRIELARYREERIAKRRCNA